MSDTVLSQSKRRFTVYAAITKRIVAAIEVGSREYRCPWHTNGALLTHPINAATLGEYRGVNVLALWSDTVSNGYASHIWATYAQWQSIGAQVQRKARGSLIVYWKRQTTVADEDDDPDQIERHRYVVNPVWVFNADQVNGYTHPETADSLSEYERCRAVESFVDDIGANIVPGFATPCYRRATDSVEMPVRDAFTGSPTSSPTESYYSTLFQELVHWTGTKDRLNRSLCRRYGDKAHAFEKLVAELGGAFMCASVGIANEPRQDHASYFSDWISLLEHDSHAVFAAADEAQVAFEHLAYLAIRNEPTGSEGG